MIASTGPSIRNNTVQFGQRKMGVSLRDVVFSTLAAPRKKRILGNLTVKQIYHQSFEPNISNVLWHIRGFGESKRFKALSKKLKYFCENLSESNHETPAHPLQFRGCYVGESRMQCEQVREYSDLTNHQPQEKPPAADDEMKV